MGRWPTGRCDGSQPRPAVCRAADHTLGICRPSATHPRAHLPGLDGWASWQDSPAGDVLPSSAAGHGRQTAGPQEEPRCQCPNPRFRQYLHWLAGSTEPASATTLSARATS